MNRKIAKQGSKLGIEFATIIVSSTLFGYYIGKKTISAAGGMVAGAFLGFLGTIFLAIKFYDEYKERNKKNGGG
ncbi:MAG: hypothetical protein ABEI78_01520 [Candidatus Nanohaloarchaea archaeon]